MNRKIVLSIFCVFMTAFFFIASQSYVFTKSNGSIVSKTGAPGEGACNQCHNSSGGGSGQLTLSIDGDPSNFTPGESYMITVEASDPDAAQYGFQMTALSGAAPNDDAISPISGGFVSGSGMEVKNNIEREYINHTSPNSDGSWTFEWIAPDEEEAITFYAASIAGNGLGDNGDKLYFQELTLEPLIADPCDDLEPITLTYDTPTCDDNGNATLTYMFGGGTGNYDVEVILNGELYFDDVITTSGFPLLFQAQDVVEISVVDAITPCNELYDSITLDCTPPPVCESFVGDFAQEEVILCDGDILAIQANSLEVGPDDVFKYLIMTNEVPSPTSIVTFNETGMFENVGALDTNTEYFVTVAAGPLPADTLAANLPDWDNPCTVYATPIPLVILEPIQIFSNVQCGEVTYNGCDDYFVEFSVIVGATGGYPAYFPGETYVFEGDDGSSFEAPQNVPFTFADIEGGTLNYTISDDAGCVYIGSVSDAGCEFELLYQVEDMPTEPIIACSTAAISIMANCITDESDEYSIGYLLHDEDSSDFGNILGRASMGDGILSIDGDLAEEYYNQSLFITGVAVAENEDGSLNYDEIVYTSSSSTSITYLAPITIEILAENCDTLTGLTSVELSVSGGYPSLDESANYLLEGAYTGEASLNEVISIDIADGESFLLNVLEDGNDCELTDFSAGPYECELVDTKIENGMAAEISIYPNPASDQVQISIHTPIKSYQVCLYDSKGQLIWKESSPIVATNGNYTVNLSDFSNGVYYLMIRSEEYVLSEKIVLNK